MTNDWDDEDDNTFGDDDSWDDDDYDDYLSREFPDHTEQNNRAGGSALWHWTAWTLVIVFVGGYLLALMA